MNDELRMTNDEYLGGHFIRHSSFIAINKVHPHFFIGEVHALGVCH